MIHGVYANHTSFHPVEFTSGLNVVLAERTETSTPKDSRNGLGKSTLFEIIDFCLGAQAIKGKGLCIKPLEDWTFTLDITLAGNRVKVTRSVESPNLISIDGPSSGWIEQPDTDKTTNEQVFQLKRWNTLLGWALFSLPRSNDVLKYKPSYRSLISYFVRRGVDAYSEPFHYFRHQNTCSIQLNVAFLLGLNWEYIGQLQELKDQDNALNAINRAVKTGAIEEVLGSVGELETMSVQLESQVDYEREALVNFKVYHQYQSIQEEADRLTASIHEETNTNITDRRKLYRYTEAVAEEKVSSDIGLELIYKEAGFIFPDTLRRTLAEAKEFHNSIIKNRKTFLQTEIERLGQRIAERNTRIEQLTKKRALSLEILSTHGALQEMTALQEKHLETKERLERVRSRISEIKDRKSRKRNIKVAKAELMKVAEQDHEQRRELWANALRLFSDNSKALYNTPGKFIINVTNKGYNFEVKINRSGSEGIAKMKIFCFDLMLSQLFSAKGNMVDFMIHDSTLYDAVDSRQRAFALERAAKVSTEQGFQYICALNSDMIPSDDFSKDFDINQYVKLRLTDKDPTGSLLGIQFHRTEK